ncbi:hypothetical protein HRW09_34930, partial [Streptomyces lunaelactis]|nr:hypothetical protein [Streptomyces lunaelactis]
MSGYWHYPDDGLDTAGYQPTAFGADVLDPTIPEGLDAHLDTHWDFENDLTQLLQAAAPTPVAPIPVDHGGPTQGCVSLPLERMKDLLR